MRVLRPILMAYALAFAMCTTVALSAAHAVQLFPTDQWIWHVESFDSYRNGDNPQAMIGAFPLTPTDAMTITATSADPSDHLAVVLYLSDKTHTAVAQTHILRSGSTEYLLLPEQSDNWYVGVDLDPHYTTSTAQQITVDIRAGIP